MPLQGKVALVTGGGQRSCLECAHSLAKQGASLALHYDSPESRIDITKFRAELGKLHPKIKVTTHGVADLSTSAAVDQLISETVKSHGKIDMVVNSAGTVLKKPVCGISEAEYDQMFAYAVFVDEQRRRCVDQFRAESTRRLRSSS